MADNTCVCCGAIIPEGRQICLICERENDVQQIPPVKTNGDRIRAMTDEEIVAFIDRITECCSDGWMCDECPLRDAGGCSNKDLLAWMKKAVTP